MSKHSPRKINLLQQILPENVLVTSAWLEKHGYSRPLIKKYLENNWLHSPARGIYQRTGANPKIKWELVLVSMQQFLELKVSVGAKSALALQGYSHYLSSSGPTEIHMYGTSIPSWANRLNLKEEFVFHLDTLFEREVDDPFFKNEKILVRRLDESYTTVDWHDWQLVVSTPERAILELINELPDNESFHQVDMLMESLSTLRPKKLSTLLEKCKRIKICRLFLWFAERHNHAWFHELKLDKVNLGSGKRSIVSGGFLDQKYLITVPEEYKSG